MLRYLNAEHHPHREQFGFLNARFSRLSVHPQEKRCLLGMTRLTHINTGFSVADKIYITELTV